MNQPTSNFDRRRIYAKERYLRSEHLFHAGKFVAVTWTIKEVVFNCTFKVMGAKAGDDATAYGPGLEFVEAPGYVFGMNRTNESMLCMVTGEGNPSKWVGRKIQLVVRLIRDRKTKTDIPALRIWSDHAIHLGRVMEQMGRKVDDEWYAANSFTGGVPFPPAEPEKPEPPATDAKLLAEFKDLCAALTNAKSQTEYDTCLAECTRLKPSLDKKSLTTLTGLVNAAKARIAAPAQSEFDVFRGIIAKTDVTVTLMNAIMDDVAKAVGEKRLTEAESVELNRIADERMAVL